MIMTEFQDTSIADLNQKTAFECDFNCLFGTFFEDRAKKDYFIDINYVISDSYELHKRNFCQASISSFRILVTSSMVG